MNTLITRGSLLLPLLAAILGHAAPADAKAPATRAEILPLMERMADTQLNSGAYRNNPPADWVGGAFYAGLARLSHVSPEPRFVEAQVRIAERHNWSFRGRVAHADDETVGQMYIDLAVRQKDLAKLDTIRRQLDEVIAGFNNPTDATRRSWDNNLARDGMSWPWWWCDALFMAPPVFARLSTVTWDRKYIDEMDKQWWITYDKLYDKEERLFFRDMVYPPQRTANGKKVFWSRGNGWVFAGTAHVLTYMPKDYPTRPKYEQLFKEMAARLKEIQQPDGLWRGSLIDPVASPWPETSGTAFFTYGMAWGINNELLKESDYRPTLEKGWAALNERIGPDGLLGFVQPIGDRPAASSAQNTQAYATGAFLLAGCEIIKLNER